MAVYPTSCYARLAPVQLAWVSLSLSKLFRWTRKAHTLWPSDANFIPLWSFCLDDMVVPFHSCALHSNCCLVRKLRACALCSYLSFAKTYQFHLALTAESRKLDIWTKRLCWWIMLVLSPRLISCQKLASFLIEVLFVRFEQRLAVASEF